MARTDFYETLGVAQDIGGGDLKLAYRALALRYHPDRNPGDAAAEARFKEISEAFAVLRDPARRAAYDRHGHAAFGLAARGGPPGFGFSFDTDAACHVFTYGDEHRQTATQPEPEARQPTEISSDAPHALAEGIIVPTRTLGADLKRTASACSAAPAAARSVPVSGDSDKPPVRKGGAPIPIGPAAGPPPSWLPDAPVKPLVDEVAIAAVGRSPAPAPLWPGSARARWSRGLRGLACFWAMLFATLGGGAAVLQHLGPPEDPVAVLDRIGAGSRPLQVGAFPLVSHAAPAAAPTVEAPPAEGPPIGAAPAPVVPLAPVADSDLARRRDRPDTAPISRPAETAARPWPPDETHSADVMSAPVEPMDALGAAPPMEMPVQQAAVAHAVAPTAGGHSDGLAQHSHEIDAASLSAAVGATSVAAGPPPSGSSEAILFTGTDASHEYDTASARARPEGSGGTTGNSDDEGKRTVSPAPVSMNTPAEASLAPRDPLRSPTADAAPAAPELPLNAERPERPADAPRMPPATSTDRGADAAFVAALLSRGDRMLSLGDISAARLLYVRAAELGSGPAAVAAGRTFDPAFAAMIGAVSIPSDPAIAAAWYAKAVERGEDEAGTLLAQLLARAGSEVAARCPAQEITAPRHAPSDLHSGPIDPRLRTTCSP